MTQRILLLVLAMSICAGFAWIYTGEILAQTRQEKTRPKEQPKDKLDLDLDETKKKGFEGVDFSYDVVVM